MSNIEFETIPVFGYNVFNGSLKSISASSQKLLINTFSPNSYGLALTDKEFEHSLKRSDVLVLDGIGIAVGSILLNGKNIKKIAGQDCFDYLMDYSQEKALSVFFLGSSQATLEKITKRANFEYPRVRVGSYSPPFKAIFSEEDNAIMCDRVNQFQPDILFIGMTAPKQEKWAFEHKAKLDAKIICTIGNVFDWYAGNSKRPAKIWIKLRLEWFVRIFHRPEIFRRNTGNQLKFLRDLLFHITYIKRIKTP